MQICLGLDEPSTETTCCRCGGVRICLDLGECGAVRICFERGEPSAEIARVEALSPWRRANIVTAANTLRRSCRSCLAVAPCKFALASASSLRRSCASERSGAARGCVELGEPSAEIVRVEALWLCPRANFLAFAAREWSLKVVLNFTRLLSQSRRRGFASPLVCASSGSRIATLKYQRIANCAPAARLENGNFGAQKYYAKCVPAAPAAIASFKYTSSARRARSSGLKIAFFVQH